MTLATGASQPFPMRPKQEWSVAEVEEHLKQMQRDIAAAQSVVVIGGGPTGIEMAGVSKDWCYNNVNTNGYSRSGNPRPTSQHKDHTDSPTASTSRRPFPQEALESTGSDPEKAKRGSGVGRRAYPGTRFGDRQAEWDEDY